LILIVDIRERINCHFVLPEKNRTEQMEIDSNQVLQLVYQFLVEQGFEEAASKLQVLLTNI
jgi:hypothetical protein